MAIKVTHINPEFTDERGYISRIVDTDEYPIRAILFIKSKKGTVRGNHYHKNDAHFVYCLKGKFIYSEKDLSKKGSRKQSVTLNPGDVVLSKPGVAHSMKFLENTEFLAITTEPREQDKYEKDLVRINLN